MRQLIVSEFLSLDGIVDSPGGGDHPRGGWTFKDVDFVPEAYELKGREQVEAGAMLLGRVSFTEFAPVWPTMEDFAQYNEMEKYVVSSTLDEADVTGTDWKNCHLLRSLEDVAELKQGSGGPIILHGSATLAQGLAAAGMVDRYHLLIFPLLLGGGKRLFTAEGGEFAKLHLVEQEAFSNGIVKAIYDVVH